MVVKNGGNKCNNTPEQNGNNTPEQKGTCKMVIKHGAN